MKPGLHSQLLQTDASRSRPTERMEKARAYTAAANSDDDADDDDDDDDDERLCAVAVQINGDAVKPAGGQY
ncbi:hypothetical protein SRHO_G00045530 [Serrasalmus rhombeus]